MSLIIAVSMFFACHVLWGNESHASQQGYLTLLQAQLEYPAGCGIYMRSSVCLHAGSETGLSQLLRWLNFLYHMLGISEVAWIICALLSV